MQPELVNLGSEPERRSTKEFYFIEKNIHILDKILRNCEVLKRNLSLFSLIKILNIYCISVDSSNFSGEGSPSKKYGLEIWETEQE